jgi:hypothetical protein
MTLTQDILDLASKGPAGLEEPDRDALLRACEKLVLALENPLDKFLRLFFVCCFRFFVIAHGCCLLPFRHRLCQTDDYRASTTPSLFASP